jgi:hypothetical protein
VCRIIEQRVDWVKAGFVGTPQNVKLMEVDLPIFAVTASEIEDLVILANMEQDLDVKVFRSRLHKQWVVDANTLVANQVSKVVLSPKRDNGVFPRWLKLIVLLGQLGKEAALDLVGVAMLRPFFLSC